MRAAVLTNNGPLLDHFARLAASVTGFPSAAVGVLDRVKSRDPRRASYGLSREQLAATVEIDRALPSGGSLTVIPDILSDPRFAGLMAPFGGAKLRFAVHMALTSPGGERAGFILLLDEGRLTGLTEAGAASLARVASMIMADRQREQRHLHLMHVADRALRVDRMLRLVSEAESCADGLTSLLEALCRHHAAAAGQIWRLTEPGQPLTEVSRYRRHAACSGPAETGPLSALHAATAETIQRNVPLAMALNQEDDGGIGLSAHVCIPIWVQQQRFGIALAFTAGHADLEAVAADIASLSYTIRPALIHKVTEERIRFDAHHDTLTKLSNRLMFQEQLRKAIARSRTTGESFAVLCLDLDGFKLVNDTHGHGRGDDLLVAVARWLRETVRETDMVARMGGDEFAIIQSAENQPDAAVALARRLLDAISRPFDLAGRRALIGVSIGVAICPRDGDSPDLMLRNADQALYRAKRGGRKTVCVFDPSMLSHEQEPFLAEQDLKEAIERGDFSLAYQPVCDAKSSRVMGFEALLRWRHPVLGHIPPDQFIPLAEQSGLIVPLGRWVLQTACAEAARWDRPASIAVNLSPLQFRQPDLPDQVADILERTGLDPSRLALEVTEGLLLDQSDLVLRTMRDLRARGIRIVLDDFGTAYASMSYLRRFPFNGIKIDKSFVRGLQDDDVTQAIVHAIMGLAHRLGLTVVAEGVETEREHNLLRNLGCQLVQGYLTGRPGDHHQARALLRSAWAGDDGMGLAVVRARGTVSRRAVLDFAAAGAAG